MSVGGKTELDQLFSKLWINYCEMSPEAEGIRKLFLDQGETVLNDHIALRTFNHPKLGIDALAKVFLKYGYEPKEDYVFKEKKLYAKYFQHPDIGMPKVFISELELEKVSPLVRKILSNCAEVISPAIMSSEIFPLSGRLWPMKKETFIELAKESEYASWVAAWGFRPNHFTINVNALSKFQGLSELNSFIESKGYLLNGSGGKIKGSPDVYLEQSSTMAPEVSVKFDDGILKIPGCYYEFAKRHKMPDGTLYHGFVAHSADKIFESTNRRAG